MNNAKRLVADLLRLADIDINGDRPFDIQVHDERFYKRVIGDRELGVGESYMDGWWQAERPDELITRLLSVDLRAKMPISPKLVRTFVVSNIQNRQSKQRAGKNASRHYDIGNDLYKLMLDKRMIYSCGYWAKAQDLDQAQEAKLELICRKLHLKPGMNLLDIGCGWGGFAEYVTRKYQVSVTGITPAKEQVAVAMQRVAGLDVDIQQKDYRDVSGKYDRIVSIGMLEHVGPKNYKRFFDHCTEMLKDDGIMLHHTIGNNRSVTITDPWIDKYIFPGGVIPSLAQISQAVEKQLVIEDVQNFGPDYDKTLMAWYANFTRHYSQLDPDKYDKTFYRMWEYYLLSCAALFRSRRLQLWQIVMRKPMESASYITAR